MAFGNGPSIVTNGLVLSLDAADRNSYPGSGTTWRDLSGRDNNGTLINGPTFDSANGGNIVCDGINDYILQTTPTLTTYSIEIIYSPLTFDTNQSTGRYNYIIGSFESNIFLRYNFFLLFHY